MMSETKQLTCPNCGKQFLASRKWQRFCTGDCRSKWHHAREVKLPLAEYEKLVKNQKKPKPPSEGR